MAGLDPQLRIVEADAAFRRLLGDRLTGRKLVEIVHPGFVEPLRTALEDIVLRRQRHVAGHAVLRVPGAEPVVAELTAVGLGAPGMNAGRIVVAVRPEGRPRGATPVEPVRLTALSAQVLEQVAAGVSTAEVARALFLSKQGVEYHVSSMVRKLGATNRTALVSRAYAAGVLKPDRWPPKVDQDYIK